MSEVLESICEGANFSSATDIDLKLLAQQLGRIPRSVVGIGARCRCGAPTVAITAPRLDGGSPFPTLYYLTHPAVVKAVSQLEATGIMNHYNELLQRDTSLAEAYQSAHKSYLEQREKLGKVVEIAGISAGGMPSRVKCLHALVAHSLAVGPGINPIGDMALQAIASRWTADTCQCEADFSDISMITAKEPNMLVKSELEGEESNSLQRTKRVAAVDCGTNTIRLLIADLLPAGKLNSQGMPFTDVLRTIEVVRLGQDVDRTGEFNAQALERTFCAVEQIAKLCAEHQVEEIKFVATSASRDVRNRDEFIHGIEQRLGVSPQIISGSLEAQLSFTGAVSMLPSTLNSPLLVVDIGGGSTELALGYAQTGELTQTFSMNVGAVRLWERYLKVPELARELGYRTWKEDLAQAHQQIVADCEKALDEAERYVDLTRVRTVVGVAGTVTTLTALHLGLDCYDSATIHGTEITPKEIWLACKRVSDATVDERNSWGIMAPGRAEVIGAGAIIWDRIIRRLTQIAPMLSSRVRVSEHDILDGIALSLR